MKTSYLVTAALAAISIAGAAGAQTAETADPATPPAAQTPPVSDPMTPADPAQAPGATAPATGETVAVGQTVKDNTGATIGSVAELKADATGKQMATIAMGADKFAVDASSLGVEDNVATINLTAAQLQAMIQKPAAE